VRLCWMTFNPSVCRRKSDSTLGASPLIEFAKSIHLCELRHTDLTLEQRKAISCCSVFRWGSLWVFEMEKIVLLVVLISAILTMAQFPDWPHDRPRFDGKMHIECEIDYTPCFGPRTKLLRATNQNVQDVAKYILLSRSFTVCSERRRAMRTIIGNILKTIMVVTVVSALMSVEAMACPQGYFQCGPVCCPIR